MDVNTTTAADSQYNRVHRMVSLSHDDDQQRVTGNHDPNLPPAYLTTPTSHMSNVTQTLELNSLPSITLAQGTDLTMNTSTATFQLEISQNLSALATATTQPLPMLWFTSPSRNSQTHLPMNDILTPVSEGNNSVGMGPSTSISETQQSAALPTISKFSSRDLDATKGPHLHSLPVEMQAQSLEGIVTSVSQLLASSEVKATEVTASNIYSMAPSQTNGASRELIPTSYTLTHGVLSSPLISQQNKMTFHLNAHDMGPNAPNLGESVPTGKLVENQVITLPAHVISNMVHLGLNHNAANLGPFESHTGPNSVNLQSMGDVTMSLLTGQGGQHSLAEIGVLEDGDSKLRQMLLRPLPATGTETPPRPHQQDAPRKLDGFVEQVSCYKCKLCPFISLNRGGVKEHVKAVHEHVVLSCGDDSDDDADAMGSPALPRSQDVAGAGGAEKADEAPYTNQDARDHRADKDHLGSGGTDGDDGKISGNLAKRRLGWALDERTKCTGDVPQGGPGSEDAEGGKQDVDNDMEDDGDVGTMAEEVDDDEPSDDGPGTSGKAKGAKRRGRPKGSKTVGVTAMRKKNPKAKINEEEMGFRCWIDSCAIRLKAQENLEYHRKCHLDQGFQCPECKQTFDHWRNTSVHLWRLHLIDMELYACDQCNYKTYSMSKLLNMHKKIHSEERPFLCDTCGKGFKTNKQLRNHKVIHLDKKRQRSLRSGECDVCHRYFSDKRMLRVHKDTVHNKLRPFLCNFCGYSASCRSTLKMHMRQHTGEKPFACDLCEYRTADHNSLRRHKMRHSGEKPYKCPFCTYACIQSSTYKTHLKNKHPGQDEGLMFSCNACSFRTIKRENFVTHVADHKNEANQEPMTTTTTLVVSGNTAVGNGQQQIEGIMAAPGLANAQFVFTALEDLRERIITHGNFTVEAPVSEERFPILAGQLKIGQLDDGHGDLVDANNVHHLHIATNEHLVHDHAHNVEQIIIKHLPRADQAEHDGFSQGGDGRVLEADQVDHSSDHIIT